MGTDAAFVCVCRPRRFVKSVDADMLTAYYTKGANSRSQFDGLSVSKTPGYERHLNAHDVYALLVHLGYLGFDQSEGVVFIPNEEIRQEFARSLRSGGRVQLAKLIRESRELQERTLAGDESYVADAIARAHDGAAGPLHYNDEQALRAAVKLAYIWSVDDYLRVDELPGGRGFADLAFLPKTGSPLPPMLIELKWDKPVDTALEQMRKRNYPAALQGLKGECMLVGVTYHEGSDLHECKIERIEL